MLTEINHQYGIAILQLRVKAMQIRLTRCQQNIDITTATDIRLLLQAQFQIITQICSEAAAAH